MPASIIQNDPNHITMHLLDGELAVGGGEWMPLNSFLNTAVHVTNIEVGGTVIISGSNGSLAVGPHGNRVIALPPNSNHGVTIATLTSAAPSLNFTASFLFIKARRTAAGAGALPVVVIANCINRSH